jgi:hypothetical protein
MTAIKSHIEQNHTRSKSHKTASAHTNLIASPYKCYTILIAREKHGKAWGKARGKHRKDIPAHFGFYKPSNEPARQLTD